MPSVDMAAKSNRKAARKPPANRRLANADTRLQASIYTLRSRERNLESQPITTRRLVDLQGTRERIDILRARRARLATLAAGPK